MYGELCLYAIQHYKNLFLGYSVVKLLLKGSYKDVKELLYFAFLVLLWA